MTGTLLLSLRALHILVAALWLGAIFLLTVFVMPAVRDVGAAGGQLMVTLHRRKLHIFMATTAGLTVLSGIWLYWLFTDGFNHDAMMTHGGLAFGIGGLCGLLAAIIGGSVIARGFKRMVALGEQAAGAPESVRAASMQEIAALRARLAAASRVVLLLVIVATVLMAIGHYV